MSFKIGLDQVGQPAPQFITNLLRAAVYLFTGIGPLVALTPAWLLSDHLKVIIGIIAGFVLLLINTAETFMGIKPQFDNTNK